MSDSVFGKIMDDIVEDIKKAENMPEIKFAVQFPKAPKDVPLRYNTVALGIKSIASDNNYSANLLYRKEGAVIESGSLKLTLSIDIFVPNKNGGKTCYDIYEKILERLIFSASHKVDSTSCEEMNYDRTTGAYIMKTTAQFNILVKEEWQCDEINITKGGSENE